jgi:hypothetical protein
MNIQKAIEILQEEGETVEAAEGGFIVSVTKPQITGQIFIADWFMYQYATKNFYSPTWSPKKEGK